jgi:origin recognition complex subunit 6
MSCDRIVARLSLPAAQGERVKRKGNELYRLSKLKMPTLGNFESCRAALCVEIALGDHLTSAFTKILQRLSTVNIKIYSQMMSRLQTVLGVRRDNGAKSLRELALQFRCTGFLEFIKSTLKTYKERFISGLPQQRQAHADFSDPKYGAAALYLCARKRRVKLDRRKLLAVVVTENGKFQDVLNSMIAICFDTVGTGQKQTALDVKQKRFLLDATAGQSSEQVAKTKEKDAQEYKEWRKRVLSANSSSVTNSESSLSSSSSTSSSSSSKSSSSSALTLTTTTTNSNTNSSTASLPEPRKKKQKKAKKQATLFGMVAPYQGPPALSKATAKQQAKENEINVRDVDAQIATLNALLD